MVALSFRLVSNICFFQQGRVAVFKSAVCRTSRSFDCVLAQVPSPLVVALSNFQSLCCFSSPFPARAFFLKK